jgi:hypothetical protein
MSLVSEASLLKRRLRLALRPYKRPEYCAFTRNFREPLCARRPAIYTLGRVSGSDQCDSEDSRLVESDAVSVGESPVYTLRKKFHNCTPWTSSKDESLLYVLLQ